MLSVAAIARAEDVDPSIRRLFAAAPPSAQLVSREGRMRWERVLGDGRLKTDDLLASVAVSGDATRVAAGTFGGEVGIWDCARGGFVARLRCGPSLVSAVTMNHDGSLIAAADYRQVGLWDVRDGKERFRLDLPMVGDLLFSPDGALLAAAATTGVHIVGADGGKAVAVLPHDDASRLQALEPGLLVSASRYSVFHLWDWRTRELRGTVRAGEDLVVAGLACGGAIAYGRRVSDPRATAWNVPDWTPASIDGLPVGSASLNCEHMVMSWRGDRAALWDPQYARVRFPHRKDALPTPRPREHEGASLAYAPDDSFVACAALDGTITLWEPETGVPRRFGEGHDSSIVGLTFADGGRVLLSAGLDGTLQHWSTETSERLRVVRAHDRAMRGFGARGDVLATSSGLTMRLWRLNDDKHFREFDLDVAADGPIAIAPGAERVFYGNEFGVSYRPAGAGGKGWIRDTLGQVAVSGDGALLVTGSTTGLVAIFDPSVKGKRRVVGSEGQHATSLAFHPAGKPLAVGCRDGTIRIVDPGSAAEVAAFAGHVGAVLAIDYSEDGRTLRSGGDDLTLRTWDVERGVETDSIALGARPRAIVSRTDRVWVGCGSDRGF